MSRLGLVCSGGGSVMATAHDLLSSVGRRPDWVIVTDRPCATETKAAARGLPCRRIEAPDRGGFSAQAASWLFDEMGCGWTLLLITRLVDAEIHGRAPCVNIHPSLLPAFPGLGALDAAVHAGVRVVGATAHLADATTDGGPILAQVWGPVPRERSLLDRLSFAQKTYLLLVVHEAVRTAGPVRLPVWLADPSRPVSPLAGPALDDAALEAAFRAFVKTEGIPWPI